MEPFPEDRRQSERRFYRTSAVCQRMDHTGTAVSAQILNLSNTGASLLLRGQYQAGDRLEVVLINPRRETIAEVKGVVRWIQKEGPNACRLGLAFDQPLRDDQVTAAV